jgi:hypothetical protein
MLCLPYGGRVTHWWLPSKKTSHGWAVVVVIVESDATSKRAMPRCQIEMRMREKLECLTLSQEHCRSLMWATSPSLSLALFQSAILEEEADVFVKCLQADCGPVRALAEGLRTLVAALGVNQGLTHFTFSNHAIGEENGNRLCQALKTYPSLEGINLQGTGCDETTRQPCLGEWQLESDIKMMYSEQKAFRMLALAEAIQENTVLK